jgi:hypothetical protein
MMAAGSDIGPGSGGAVSPGALSGHGWGDSPADDPKWIEPFSGLSEMQFARLVALVRRRGGDVQRGRPWRLPLADRVLLVATYWRTNLTLRQVAPLFGVSKSAADRIFDHLAPLLAIAPVRRPRKDTVYIVDGTLVPTRDRTIAASSKNYRYSTNVQVVIDANSRLFVAIGLPLPGSRNDCRAFTESGVDRAAAQHPPSPTATKAPAAHLRDCRLKGSGGHQAMLGIARLHNMALTR